MKLRCCVNRAQQVVGLAPEHSWLTVKYRSPSETPRTAQRTVWEEFLSSRGWNSQIQQRIRLGVPTWSSLVSTIPRFHCSKGRFPSLFCSLSRGCCSPIHWLCFHLCGKGFSYFSMQALTPSLTPGPAELNPVQTGYLQFHTPDKRHQSFLFKSLPMETSLEVFGRRLPRTLSFLNLTKFFFFPTWFVFLNCPSQTQVRLRP